MKTFKQIIEHLQEAWPGTPGGYQPGQSSKTSSGGEKVSSSGGTIHKGKKYSGDEEGAEKAIKATQPKRGRGRPAGAHNPKKVHASGKLYADSGNVKGHNSSNPEIKALAREATSLRREHGSLASGDPKRDKIKKDLHKKLAQLAKLHAANTEGRKIKFDPTKYHVESVESEEDYDFVLEHGEFIYTMLEEFDESEIEQFVQELDEDSFDALVQYEEMLDEGYSHLQYSGYVNDKEYSVTVPRRKELGDYSDKELHHKISKENPHLAHHEVTAIVNSGGEDESHEEVTHNGKTYKHHVVNDQEPRAIYESNNGEKLDEVCKESLHPNQKVLDKNKNNKLDAEDFKMLRKEEVELEEQDVAEGSEQDDPYRGVTPPQGKTAARNAHRLGKAYTNPHNPKYHKKDHAAWEQDYSNEMSRLKKKSMSESKSGNPHHGYSGQHSSEDAEEKFAQAHAMVKKHASAHLAGVEDKDTMVTHYLDSVHGRHLAGNENPEYIMRDFKKFKKNYKPEMFEQKQETLVDTVAQAIKEGKGF